MFDLKNKRYSVVSFDIFDTLLLRPYIDPQEVWRVMEEEFSAPGFAKVRKEADAQTYRECIARNGETTIEAAYALIPQWKHMMQKEMDIERKVLCVNPEMKALWDKCEKEGKKRVIVSDMYMSSDFLKSVLIDNGIDGWDGFYLSRDYDCRKSSGKLFEVMLKDMNVHPEEVLHIGDNKDSDVEQPLKLGINVQHYRRVSDHFFDICPFARHIDQRLAGVLALGWHKFVCNNPDHTYWNRLGFIMGGVLGYMYVKWVVETAQKLGINRLMFVARDGYIWQKICNELYPEIRTDYVYAPRLTSIAVNGAVGNDPWAIADRQRYIDTHLKGVDTDAIKQEYIKYLSTLNIDEHTALVDGCSSGFSAQCLMETCLGRPVFSFYLLAMAKMHNAAALYSTTRYSLPFQMLSEFMFGAPTPPIIGINNKAPIYNDCVLEAEMFKISVTNDICEGVLACVREQKLYGQVEEPQGWIKYADAFVSHLTAEDRRELAKASNAPDVEQLEFKTITWTPLPKRKFSVHRFGRFSVFISFSHNSILYSVRISPRKWTYTVVDMGMKFNIIEM